MRYSTGLVSLIGLIVAAGCSGIERTVAPPRAARMDRSGQVSVPQIMRGTISAEAALDGYNAVPIYANGLVVGLDGTGSSDIPPAVRAFMLANATRHGIGQKSSGWSELSPERLINSRDTSVVVVEGVIPPGAVKGTRFDVNVFVYPTASTTSLEGGRLYTADLVPRTRPDETVQVLPPTGSRQAAALATAAGPLLINPFAEPGSTQRDTINLRSGRILGGGVVLEDLPLKLRLYSPSHARVMIMQEAINTRFPTEPGQREDTAHGESDEAIEITVPPSYRDDTATFIELLRHMTIRQVAPEAVAMTIRRHVVTNPSTADRATWRWRALGPRAIPTIRDLYSHPDLKPRLAAVRAGAKLDDALATGPLVIMALESDTASRIEAIGLLAQMGVDPRIDIALRKVLDDSDERVRLAGYDALLQRRDPSVKRFVVDDKFIVDVVASSVPMVYIALQGMPRLALFGKDLQITLPVTVTAWQRRFMIRGDSSEETVEVYFRENGSLRGDIHRVNARLTDFVQFLGHTTAVEEPVPGLGMTYGEVVGILHQIWRQGYLEADFKAEQDPILAAMMARSLKFEPTERPEFGPEEDDGRDPETGEEPPPDGVTSHDAATADPPPRPE